ncbi:MAG: DNA repair protein RecO [Alphaproteobacteria bacterium]|nr:DNA repair protein RecO [Alphaproteobacteria bacterium]MBE8221053.1 DNA repair protein RecO [Alphaproteobacteria bacterium]
MEWRSEGLIIRTRPHGEGNAIVDIFTREQGRYVGLVRGGNSRKQRPILQSGNMVSALWRARLSEQLGVLTAENLHAYSAEVLDNNILLTAMQSMCALLQMTPERHAYARLYDAVQVLLSSLSNLSADDDGAFWLPLYVRFEMMLLEEIGFGLDMEACAVSGVKEGLTHISPRSGRAVCAEVAAPYGDKLLPLPSFLLLDNAAVSKGDVLAGLALTGYFLERRCYTPNQLTLPPIRARLINILKK